MSPLPKKKKTPEELAALRESLGISSEGPPTNAPGVVGKGPAAPPEAPRKERAPEVDPLPAEKARAEKPEKAMVPAAEPEPAEKSEPEAAEDSSETEKPVVLKTGEVPEAKAVPAKTFRKSKSLTVDKPKKVVSKDSGQLPTRKRSEAERIPLEKATKPSSAGTGSLPTRKHSDQELAKLRKAPVQGAEAPAIQMANRTAGPLTLVVVYALGFLPMLLAVVGAISARVPLFDLPFEWLQNVVALPNFTMILFGMMAGGVTLMLLGAGWIFFKKPISQHHAAILTVIAVLVLVFGTLYLFPELHGA